MKTRIAIIVAVVVLALAALLTIGARLAAVPPVYNAPLSLRGTVVTPDGILQDGYVLVEKGRITQVSEAHPTVGNAVEIDTDGILYPGLIDVHNHVSWNVLPRWVPPRRYENRYEW